jgi:hypothetical protein
MMERRLHQGMKQNWATAHLAHAIAMPAVFLSTPEPIILTEKCGSEV